MMLSPILTMAQPNYTGRAKKVNPILFTLMVSVILSMRGFTGILI